MERKRCRKGRWGGRRRRREEGEETVREWMLTRIERERDVEDGEKDKEERRREMRT